MTNPLTLHKGIGELWGKEAFGKEYPDSPKENLYRERLDLPVSISPFIAPHGGLRITYKGPFLLYFLTFSDILCQALCLHWSWVSLRILRLVFAFLVVEVRIFQRVKPCSDLWDGNSFLKGSVCLSYSSPTSRFLKWHWQDFHSIHWQ